MGLPTAFLSRGRPLKGPFYLRLSFLATRKRVNKLFQAHLIRYLIFVKLMLDVLRNLLLISPYCVNIV